MTRHPDPQVHTRIDDYHDQGIVARIVFDYPSRLNVMSTESAQLLRDAFQSVSTREDLRVVVLTGMGDRAFIGGADIKEFAALNPDTARIRELRSRDSDVDVDAAHGCEGDATPHAGGCRWTNCLAMSRSLPSESTSWASRRTSSRMSSNVTRIRI